MGYDNMNYNNSGGGGGMGPMGNQPMTGGQQQMNYNNSMGYNMNTGTGGPNTNMMAGPQMQNIQGSRFPSQSMPGTRPALQNMLRSRTGVPAAQYGGPPQQMSGMMRPSGSQYPGNMMPTNQGMGGMSRPAMYSSGGGNMMNPNYGGMQGGYGSGYG